MIRKLRDRLLFAGLFALFVLAIAVLPAKADESIACDKTAIYDTNTNGATVMISKVATRAVYVCGYTLVGGGTATVKFEYGTGTTCATGETALTPAYSLLAQTVVSDASSFFRGIIAPPGNDVCIKTSAGVAIQAILHYGQR